MEKLLGKSIEELGDICSDLGLPKYSAGQIADWLYRKRVFSIDEMTNLSLRSRASLAERFEVGGVRPSGAVISADGTKKYLFPTHTQRVVESVVIPDGERTTLCVSSQAGCRMGCRFCMTARGGFGGNIDVAEILSQFFYIEESESITNAVFMGMGEPLDNLEALLRAIEILTADYGCLWSPKRITVSTIGINKSVDGTPSPLERFLNECRAHLAISMHSPISDLRRELMPSEGAYPLKKTLEIIRRYDFTGQRRVSFEYILFDGINDTKECIEKIIKELKGIECRVNLIRFHDIGDTVYRASCDAVIEHFKESLSRAGIITTIRASRGEDIAAACGMLAGENRNRNS